MSRSMDVGSHRNTKEGPSRAGQMTSSSRLPTFSNFRRGLSNSQLPKESSSDQPYSGSNGLREMSDGPSIGKAPAPARPPKPVGLRVKKAKALSISLLTGNGVSSSSSSSGASQDQGAKGEASSDSAGSVKWRGSRMFMPHSAVTPPRRHLEDEDDVRNRALAFRPQSAMDHYREHGPSRGLASPEWGDLDAGFSKKKKMSELGSSMMSDDKVESDELYIIGQKPGTSTLGRKSSEMGPSQQSVLGDASMREASLAPHLPASLTFDFERERDERDSQRSQTSLGMYHSEESRLRYRSGAGHAASSLSNPYNANSHEGSGHRTPPSMTSSPYGRHTLLALNDGAGDQHMRTSSSVTLDGFTSSLPVPIGSSRNRSQSHAALHPMTQQAERPEVAGFAPPPRRKYAKAAAIPEGTGLRAPSSRFDDDSTRYPARSSSPFPSAGSLQAIGQQLGGIGAAVGKRGWDMMKSWNNGGSGLTSPLSPSRAGSNGAAVNEATKVWNSTPEAASLIPVRGGASLPKRDLPESGVATGVVFGKPLREAVFLTRLNRVISSRNSNGARLSSLDLGSHFSVDLPQLSLEDEATEGNIRVSVDRLDARRQYLPAIVTRCVESIEKWGVVEEGIYRLSGRSSHTAKLKTIFDSNRRSNTLQLADIGPAELDLNSVCSALKAYLRALPDSLLSVQLAPSFNTAVQQACGVSATGEISRQGADRVKDRRESVIASPAEMNRKIAAAILPLMKNLPAVNWYLLREISMHLGDLTRESVVKQTKMPLSNLCLVLAPTLSLSVVVVRALVEEREMLFGQSCPLPDYELDDPIVSLKKEQPGKGRRMYFQPSRQSDSFAGEQLRLREERDAKRASIATVKALGDSDKRVSTSSVLTVQGASGVGMDAQSLASDADWRQRSSSASRRSSDFYAFDRSDSSRNSTEPEGEDAERAPPIAAHYIHIRKRSSSLANSVDSTQSIDNSTGRLMQLRMPSSTSLSSSGALGGSTLDSSLLSSADQDSPKTTDDDWPVSLQSTLGTSSSNNSMTSLSKRSAGGGLDRPRPTTPNAARFFSR